MSHIQKIFDLLDDWRNLPAYQLERRSDIFFAIYLNRIIKSRFGFDIDFIIPEFPVRIGQISEKHSIVNQSFKIDFLLFDSKAKKVFLLELKTDQNSRREKQDWYLERAASIGIDGLVEGLIKIYQATNQKIKFGNLIEKIEKIGWIAREGDKLINQNVGLRPEIIYLQPINEKNEANIISFNDVISELKSNSDPFADRFVVSLEKWKENPNVNTFMNSQYLLNRK